MYRRLARYEEALQDLNSIPEQDDPEVIRELAAVHFEFGQKFLKYLYIFIVLIVFKYRRQVYQLAIEQFNLSMGFKENVAIYLQRGRKLSSSFKYIYLN